MGRQGRVAIHRVGESRKAPARRAARTDATLAPAPLSVWHSNLKEEGWADFRRRRGLNAAGSLLPGGLTRGETT